MSKRTQIICMCEGEIGSTDAVFINRLIKSLNPQWIRSGNAPRISPSNGRAQLISAMPAQLTACLKQGGHTTLMVWADVDDETDPGALKELFWKTVQAAGHQRDDFESVVFIFEKDRIENWIEFLNTGKTDENAEGPRVEPDVAVEAAKKLAELCTTPAKSTFPPSLE